MVDDDDDLGDGGQLAPRPEQVLDELCTQLAMGYRRALLESEMEIYIDRVIRTGAVGGTDAQLATSIGVSITEMNRFAAEHKAFLDALMFARSMARTWWSMAMKEATTNPGIDYKVVYRMHERFCRTNDDGKPAETRPALPPVVPPDEEQVIEDLPADYQMTDTQLDEEIRRMVEAESQAQKWQH